MAGSSSQILVAFRQNLYWLEVGNSRAAYGVVVCTALIALIGCGDGRPIRVPVSGQVSIDGEPLQYGSVMFIPDEGRGSGGSINSDGRFSLTCYEENDGVIPGKFGVRVRGVEIISEGVQKWHAPKKYADERTSELEFTIKSASDDIQIDLTWGGSKPFIERL